jgi:hypothetical protein
MYQREKGSKKNRGWLDFKNNLAGPIPARTEHAWHASS